MTTETRSSERSALVLLALGLVACGGDSKPGGGPGIGDLDAAVELDAGSDAEVADAGGGPRTAPTCSVDPVTLSIPIDRYGSRTWDAVQADDDIRLAYEVPVCTDTPEKQTQRIDYLSFASTGKFGKAAVAAGADGESCQYTRTPCLASDAKGEPVLLYSSSATGTVELFQTQIGKQTPSTRLTTGSESDTEEHTRAAVFGPSNLLAYVNAFAAVQGPSIGQVVTRRPSGSEQEIVSRDEGLHIADLALTSLGSDAEYGGVIAWVADLGPKPQISAQFLDKAGKPLGKPSVLSGYAGAYSNVAIQTLRPGQDPEVLGAVVYTIATDYQHTELRFRTIKRDGTFGDESEVTNGLVNARGIGLAPFASGYVLVYRVVVGAQTTMHAKIVDLRNNTAAYGDRLLVSAGATGDAPKVFVTSDGRVTTVFTDTTEDGATLRVVRAICDP